MLNKYLIFLGLGILGVIAHRLQKYIMPRSYFYYSRIIDGIDEGISFVGIVFRFLIPIIIGGTAAIVATVLNFDVNPELYGGFCSLLIIFLLVWPDFLNPDDISPQFTNAKWKLYGLYILLFSMFFTQGFFGAKSFLALYPLLSPLNKMIDWESILNNLISSLIFLILSAGVTYVYLKLFKE